MILNVIYRTGSIGAQFMNIKCKKFIENHIEIIENEDWEELYYISYEVNMQFTDMITVTNTLKQVASDQESFDKARERAFQDMLFEAARVATSGVYPRNKFIFDWMNHTCGFIMRDAEEIIENRYPSNMELVYDGSGENIEYIRIK